MKYKGSFSIKDRNTLSIVKSSTKTYIDMYPLIEENQNYIKNKFLNNYKSWMVRHHSINGIDNFTKLSFSNGTTESFLYFYLKHKTKRLRILKGEYFYHTVSTRSFFKNNSAFIEDDKLRVNDVVVISVPFSDTGNIPKNLYSILEECSYLNIPVLLDLAYINLAKNLHINLNYSCIECIVTSLSKFFPVENFRIGIRLERSNAEEDQLTIFNEDNQNYINLLSLFVGYELLCNFDSNYIYDTYKDAQDYFCGKLSIEPSSCVIFGIDYNNKFPEYNRGSNSNRLCFSKMMSSYC